jgi:hypothetical protein
MYSVKLACADRHMRDVIPDPDQGLGILFFRNTNSRESRQEHYSIRADREGENEHNEFQDMERHGVTAERSDAGTGFGRMWNNNNE